MKINPEELTRIIGEKISQFQTKVDISKVGVVLSVGDGIAQIYGLRDALSES